MTYSGLMIESNPSTSEELKGLRRFLASLESQDTTIKRSGVDVTLQEIDILYQVFMSMTSLPTGDLRWT
jgi:hypothetical protein